LSNIDYPYQFDSRGRTASIHFNAHVEQMIEQLLFTSPGERVNRPTFGTGLMQLIFAPNSDELAAATQFLVQGALQQWLGDIIQVNSVQVATEDSTLQITIEYMIRSDGTKQVATFTKGAAST
jgi:phage baseplate assembly protein W